MPEAFTRGKWSPIEEAGYHIGSALISIHIVAAPDEGVGAAGEDVRPEGLGSSTWEQLPKAMRVEMGAAPPS